jgi:hypothetical protein
MRALAVVLALSIACLAYAVPATAQEGHPVKGSWIGKWDKNTIHGADVIVVNWDGDKITGMINPGTDNIVVKNASLNPDTWVVHLEGDGKDKAGAILTYVIEGKIENLAMANRSIVGTWKNGKESGPFKISRQ